MRFKLKKKHYYFIPEDTSIRHFATVITEAAKIFEKKEEMF